jgi:ParB-like chromosome segregation protein Spo0J
MPKKAAEAQDIKIGFETDTVRVPLSKITPLKLIAQTVRESEKFQQIVASIREVGVIEPPVVAPKKKPSDPYLLLDGHLRVEALKILGESDVTCLVSTDDEAFTYNKHISRLSPIQEHRMILEAIKRGVSEAKIARALNLNVANIVRKRNLLDGRYRAAVILELLGHILHVDASPAADIFVIGTLIRILKPAPAGDIEHQDHVELRGARLHIVDKALQCIAAIER